MRVTGALAIIPAFNEEASLAASIRDLRAHVDDLTILVIDDGSRDRTAAVAVAEGALVARLPFNMGIGAALRTGFRYAAEASFERAFQFDADGQHDAAEVAALMQGLEEGADLVIGSRFINESEYVVGRTRSLAMRILRLLVRALLGRGYTDTSSGFRGFSRTAIEFFADRYPKEYMDSVEALVTANYAGLVVREVPVRMRERTGGVPSNRSLRLAYHYVRIVSLLALTASRRGKKEQSL